MAEEKIGAKELYDRLYTDRSTTLDRAIDMAELSLPYLVRDTGSDESTEYPNNYVRGFVAELVSNLTGKLVPAIIPTNQPFHRLVATEEAMQNVSDNNPEIIKEIERKLASKDEKIFRTIQKFGFRTTAYPMVDHAIVTGNACVEKLDDDNFRLFSLENYVVRRSPNGKIIDLVIREVATKNSLPEDVVGSIMDKEADAEVEIYTICSLVDGKYEVRQEIEDEIVSGSEQTLTNIEDRFLVIAWNLLQGENYGRGHVEKYKDTIEDLNKHLMVLSKSAIVNSKTILTVNPNGMTKYKDFVNANTGDVIVGNETDIGVVRTQKHNDLQSSMKIIEDYKRELSRAFLMSSGAVRDSERTTKYEIQVLMNEADGGLGGAYTSLATQVQRPLVNWALKKLKIEESSDIEVDIISGAEALGKNIESLKIQDLLENVGMLAQLAGQEVVAKELNVENIISSMVANSGVASKNLVLTTQEKEAMAKAEAEKQMASMAAQGAIPQAAQNMVGQGQ